MILVQHICKFFCLGCCGQNLLFHLLAFILWYQLILCLFEAFQLYARTSHPLKKVRLEKWGSLYLGLFASQVFSIKADKNQTLSLQVFWNRQQLTFLSDLA